MILDVFLNVLAFTFRTSALVCLVLLVSFFSRATGPMVPRFKELFWALAFLLMWVEVASVAELVGYMDRAHSIVELTVNWIFVPNLVISIALLRLLLHLHQQSNRKKD